MGYGITAYVETEVDSEWRWWATVRIDTDDQLFSVIAGESSLGVKHIAGYNQVLGPRDYLSIGYDSMSDSVFLEYEESLDSIDCSNVSWMTYSEANQCQMAYMAHGNDPNPDLSAICALMDELDKRVGEVRLVFWFEG